MTNKSGLYKTQSSGIQSNEIKKTEKEQTEVMGLETAPKEIQLAVDLIQLLEENDLAIDITIKALEIVLQDFKNKIN